MNKLNAGERLRNAKISEETREIEQMLRTIKNEEYKLLTNFMFLSYEDLEVYVDVTRKGEYILSVRALTRKLIDAGKSV
jgi:hypothetical protein